MFAGEDSSAEVQIPPVELVDAAHLSRALLFKTPEIVRQWLDKHLKSQINLLRFQGVE
jgi:hypothetical protein